MIFHTSIIKYDFSYFIFSDSPIALRARMGHQVDGRAMSESVFEGRKVAAAWRAIISLLLNLQAIPCTTYPSTSPHTYDHQLTQRHP